MKNELTACLDELRNCGMALVKLADALSTQPEEPAEEATKPKPKKTKKTAKAEEPESSEEAQDEAPWEEPEKPVSLVAVRAVLAEKSRAGYTDEVKDLISKYGAEKLSDIAPENYAALLAEAEVLGDD